jgi:hypothetical protein
MTDKTFADCFAWLEKFHGKHKQLDDQVRVEWQREFAKEHDEVFCEASQYATQKLPPGMFPTIERMRGFVTEAREKLWQKVKDAEPRAPLSKPAPDYRNVPHGIEALALIKKIAEHGYTDEVMAELEAMGEKHLVWAAWDWKAERAACRAMRDKIEAIIERDASTPETNSEIINREIADR